MYEGRKHKGIFAMYKGEQCLAIGTLDEIAEELGVKIDTVRWYLTDTAKKKISKYKGEHKELISLGEDEE